MQMITWLNNCKKVLCAAVAAGFLMMSAGAAQAVPVPVSMPGMPVLSELADAGPILNGSLRIKSRFAPGEKRADDSLEMLQRLQQRNPVGTPRNGLK